LQTELTIKLPPWVSERWRGGPQILPTAEDRMRLAVSLARENVRRGTGGPFGACIFDAEGRLIAVGVNVVVAQSCSLLHAEMVAIALAQKELGRYDIGDGGKADYELVSSTEPCAMCFGAIPWAGVTRLLCGARDEDARAIGFDEGAKLSNWQDALEARGVEVVRDLLRQEAVDVLELYARIGGIVYSPNVSN